MSFELEGRRTDGTLGTLSLDNNNILLVKQASSKYEYDVQSGTVFYAANQSARTWSVALNTTHTGLVVYNPAGSGVNLVILKASFALSVAPVGIASIGLFTGYIAAGIVTHTTPLTPVNCLTGGAAGLGGADEAATLVGTPTWALPIMGGFTAGALPSTSPAVIDVDGAIVVKPGGYCGIGALTAAVGFGSIIWKQVSI